MVVPSIAESSSGRESLWAELRELVRLVLLSLLIDSRDRRMVVPICSKLSIMSSSANSHLACSC